MAAPIDVKITVGSSQPSPVCEKGSKLLTASAPKAWHTCKNKAVKKAPKAANLQFLEVLTKSGARPNTVRTISTGQITLTTGEAREDEFSLLKRSISYEIFQEEYKMTFDIIIKNGVICDGTGAPSYTADIGITGSTISYIGDLRGSEAGQIIDVADKTITLGFIDPHTHVDMSLFIAPQMEPYLKQGVTTVVTGNCGHGSAPSGKEIFYGMILDSDYLDDIGADEMGLDQLDAFMNIFIEDPFMAGDMVAPSFSRAVEILMNHEGAMPCSDGCSYPKELNQTGNDEIPVYLNSPNISYIPRFLTHYCLDNFEEAVHRASGLVADRFNIKNRGKIKTGNFADITILDRKALHSFDEEDNPLQDPLGTELVLVNGQIAVKDGVLTGRFAGEMLRKSR